MMKTALIGAGVICEQHITGLKRVPYSELVGVCDLSPAMATYSAGDAGCVKPFLDYKQMLRETQPDVVHVLTPPRSHPMIIQDCLEAGAHVLCEKPVVLERDELHRLWRLARSHDLWLIEDHNYRFNQPIVRLQEMLEQDKLGQVQEIEIRMALAIRDGGRFADRNLPNPIHKLPAGVIHDFITHLCYLGLLFVPGDKKIDRVSSLWSNHGGGEEGDPFTVDDLDATVILGNTHLKIRFTARTWPDQFTVSLRGSEGAATVDLFQPQIQATVKRGGGKYLDPLFNRAAAGLNGIKGTPIAFFDKILQKSAYEGLHRWVELTYQALRDGNEPPIVLEDMDQTLALIDALLAEENRA